VSRRASDRFAKRMKREVIECSERLSFANNRLNIS
jgi:hypothetical protein